MKASFFCNLASYLMIEVGLVELLDAYFGVVLILVLHQNQRVLFDLTQNIMF